MEQLDICVRFGRNVRTVRRSKDVSQEELAEKADLHRTYISALERGRGRNPSIRVAHRIAVALGVSLGSLFE